MQVRCLVVSNPICTFADVEVGLPAGWGDVLPGYRGSPFDGSSGQRCILIHTYYG